MPALVPQDRKVMSAAANDWPRQHPETQAVNLDRLRQLIEPGARHSYSILTMKSSRARSEAQGKATPEPCIRCGEWTHAYCESCIVDLGPPYPICSRCDEARLVCPICLANGRSWEGGRSGKDSVFFNFCCSACPKKQTKHSKILPPNNPFQNLSPNRTGCPFALFFPQI